MIQLTRKDLGIAFKQPVYQLTFDYDASLINKVKQLEFRRFVKATDFIGWEVPLFEIKNLVSLIDVENFDLDLLNYEELMEFNHLCTTEELSRTMETNKILKVKNTYFANACDEYCYNFMFEYDKDIVVLLHSIDEEYRIYDKVSRTWYVSKEQFLERVVHKLDINSFVTDNEFKKDYEDFLCDKEKRELDREIRNQRKLKNFSFEYKTSPFPHQVEALKFGMQHDMFLIADEQGLGKTKESIDITVARKYEINKCLIVCGINSVKYNWCKEIELHSFEQSLLCVGTIKKKTELINEWLNNDVYYCILNIESIRNERILNVLVEAINEQKIGAVVIDEIHKAKNHESKQGMAIQKLKSKIRIGLSGTPMNKVVDLWNIMKWLQIEQMDYWAFKNYYCVMDKYGNIIKTKNTHELNAKLNLAMIRRKKENVLELPEKLYKQEYVELSTEQVIMYNKIKEGLLEIYDEIIEARDPLSQLLRLRQCTSAFNNKNDAKLQRIDEILKEEIVCNNEKAIIYTQWKDVAERYKTYFKKYKPAYVTGEISIQERQRQVDQFQNDDDCKIIIGTIGSMGTGFTLNKASNVIFVDKSWVAQDVIQAEDRAHRIGTKQNVIIYSLIAIATIDEYVESYLKNNQIMFDTVVDGKFKNNIKDMIDSILKK